VLKKEGGLFSPLLTMSLYLVEPSVRKRLVYMPKTASVAIADGELVFTTSGAVSALSASSDERVAGVAQVTITSASANYAAVAGTTGSMIPVLIDEDGVWEADPSSTTNEIANGTQLDWSTSKLVHVTNSTHDQFIVRNPSGATNLTKIRGVIARWEGSEPAATN